MTRPNETPEKKRKLPVHWVDEEGFDLTPAVRTPDTRLLLAAPPPPVESTVPPTRTP